jgi:NAD(P)-dependent dehydrogenase (short-subunit alcohol dehydrogenase family)
MIKLTLFFDGHICGDEATNSVAPEPYAYSVADIRLDQAHRPDQAHIHTFLLLELTPEGYADTFDTNVLGTFLSMKHELRVMLAQGSGSIVNISSIMGERGAANASLYTASKHAVEGMTKSAALEGASSGVRVNAVAPGPVDTELLNRFTGTADRKAAFLTTIPLKRAGKPEEIADAIMFVPSQRANFITGQIIRVNGGKTAS